MDQKKLRIWTLFAQCWLPFFQQYLLKKVTKLFNEIGFKDEDNLTKRYFKLTLLIIFQYSAGIFPNCFWYRIIVHTEIIVQSGEGGGAENQKK